MSKLLGISAELSSPPSSPSVFRDVTLYASIKKYEVIAISPVDMIDFYNIWFKRYGLYDYVLEIISEDIKLDLDVNIEGGVDSRLTAHNLHAVLQLI